MQFDPEEAETLRRADERYQLWRPKGRARGGLTPAGGILRSHDLRPLRPPRKFHECLARGGTRYEAFKQHKNRLRTRAFQDFYGDVKVAFSRGPRVCPNR